jgi:hypothetical protein
VGSTTRKKSFGYQEERRIKGDGDGDIKKSEIKAGVWT